MIIRAEQVDHLRSSRQQAFVDFALERLPALGARLDDIPREIQEKRVRVGMVKADSHGLNTDRSTIVFILLMFTVAPDFYAHPEFRAILLNLDEAPDERMRILLTTLPSRAWSEAKHSKAQWEGE